MDKIQFEASEAPKFETEIQNDFETLTEALLSVVGGGSGDVIHG